MLIGIVGEMRNNIKNTKLKESIDIGYLDNCTFIGSFNETIEEFKINATDNGVDIADFYYKNKREYENDLKIVKKIVV